jgi:hypothetical protein
MEQWLTAPATQHIGDAGRFLAAFRAAGGKTQATLNHLKKDSEQRIVPRATQQFIESMMWSAKSNDARDQPPCAMLETLAEGCTKKMISQMESAKKCKDVVPPKVRDMLNVAKAVAERSTALVEFTTDSRNTAKVTPDPTKPQFSYLVDLTQLDCPTCSCEENELMDWACEHCCLAAHKRGVLDFSALLSSHNKTSDWQAAYGYFDKKPLLYPSTAVGYTEAESDLHLAAYVPKPSGRPSKARRKSAQEIRRNSGNGGFGGSQQSNAGGSQAGPSSSTGVTPARGRAQMCSQCGQPRKGHTCPKKPKA